MLLNILLFYVLPVSLALWSLRGQPDGDDRDIMIFVFIPGLSVLGYLGLIDIIRRISQSSWKCTFGHRYEIIFDSEAEKWKDGKMPFRVSRGGYSEHRCTKCAKQTTTHWRAF